MPGSRESGVGKKTGNLRHPTPDSRLPTPNLATA